MKKFNEFLSEEMLPYAQTEKGFVGVDNGPVRDNINIHLTAITAKPYATPYHAMEMVRKVLAPFSIFPPSVNFLDGESGHEIFEISQFGDKMGMTNNGEVVHKMASPYYVYFEYAMNDTGSFDIFCEIVTEEELEEIVADVEDEMDGEDTTTGNMADAEDSYDAYKAKNQVNEDYDKNAANDAKDIGYIASGARRKDDKKKWNKWHKDANKEATTGMKKKEPLGEEKNPLDTVPGPYVQKGKEKSNPNRRAATLSAKALKQVIKKGRKRKTMEEENLNEVSQKAATDAYAASSNYDLADHPKADKILGHIKRKFGKKAEDNAEKAAHASYFGRGTPRPGNDKLIGGLRSGLSDKLTKSGKIPKITQKAMASTMKKSSWSYRKPVAPKGILPEENLNELHGKSKVDKEKLKAHIRKKHDAAWEKTIETRKEKKSVGSKDTKDIDTYRNRLAKMHNKLDEESLNENKGALKAAREARKKALDVGTKHPDYNKHMRDMHLAMAKYTANGLDGGELFNQHKSSAAHYAKNIK